jgi:hypothetical protein
LFSAGGYAASMPEAPERLTPATADDVADALAFALRFQGRKRVENARRSGNVSNPDTWKQQWTAFMSALYIVAPLLMVFGGFGRLVAGEDSRFE